MTKSILYDYSDEKRLYILLEPDGDKFRFALGTIYRDKSVARSGWSETAYRTELDAILAAHAQSTMQRSPRIDPAVGLIIYECVNCHAVLRSGAAIANDPRCLVCGDRMQEVREGQPPQPVKPLPQQPLNLVPPHQAPDSQIRNQNDRRIDQVRKLRPGRKA